MCRFVLSIVIPVYNNENEISETVAPFLKLKDSASELIFINDGSTDNTELVLQKIKTDNPQIAIRIYNQENQGVSAARNKGIELSQGKYIYFCDADDLVDDSLVEKIYEKSASECDIIFWKHNISRSSGVQRLTYEEIEMDSAGTIVENECLFGYIMNDKFRLCMGTYVVRKDLLIQNDIFFTQGCRYGEDLEFIFKIILNADKIRYIPEELYTYIRREGSAMAQYTIKRFDAPQMVLRLIEYIDAENVVISDINRKYIQNDYFAKQFIYSVEFCLQFLTVSKFFALWGALKKEYPNVIREGKKVLKKISMDEIGYTQKRMYIMKCNLYVYSLCIMIKNSLKRK